MTPGGRAIAIFVPSIKPTQFCSAPLLFATATLYAVDRCWSNAAGKVFTYIVMYQESKDTFKASAEHKLWIKINSLNG
jgi:hypothetical protein